MRVFFIISALVAASLVAGAQNIDAIADLYNAKKYKEARAAVDKMLADPKNATNSDAWYFKGRIYNEMSREAAVPKVEAYNLKLAAFEAFQAAQKTDQKDLRMKMESYASYLDLYLGLYDLGASQFNDKDFGGAYQSFSKALDVKDFILGKKYEYSQIKLYPLDTALVFNTAIAAGQAKDEANSIKYYRMLADANLKDKNYLDVYQILVDYYLRTNDESNFKMMVDRGRSNYPTDPFWDEMEVKYVKKKGDQAALFTKYEELIARNPNDFYNQYNYAIELYNSIYTADKRPADEMARKEKLSSVLTKAMAADTSIDASMLMCNHSFNYAADYSTAASLIKGNKPEEVKKRNDLRKLYQAKMDECLGYCNKVANHFNSKASLSTNDKVKYRVVLGYMEDIYSAKGDAKKAAEIKKKKDAL